jgi:hypothetical protein
VLCQGNDVFRILCGGYGVKVAFTNVAGVVGMKQFNSGEQHYGK